MPEPAGPGAEFETSVFVNCPFDDPHKPMFEATVFAVFDCGYRPRCALEAYDAGEVRIEKIVALVRSCHLGVHDVSRTELNAPACRASICPSSLGCFSEPSASAMPCSGARLVWCWVASPTAIRGVVQIRVTPKRRNPFAIKTLSVSGVAWKWHLLNHALSLLLATLSKQFLRRLWMAGAWGRDRE